MTNEDHSGADPDEDFDEDELPQTLGAPRTIAARRRSRNLNDHRAQLARSLLLMLFGLGALLIVCVTFGPSRSQEDVREVAAIIYPPLITLGGTSFAWFYATRERRSGQDDADGDLDR